MRKVSLFALVAVALVGCAGKPSLNGKYTSTSAASGQPANSEWEFTSGKLTMSSEAMGQKIIVKGTFTEAEGKMTMTPTEFDIPGLPAAQKAQMDKMFESQKGKPTEFKVEHKSADEVVLTPATAGQGGAVTLVRKKA